MDTEENKESGSQPVQPNEKSPSNEKFNLEELEAERDQQLIQSLREEPKEEIDESPRKDRRAETMAENPGLAFDDNASSGRQSMISSGSKVSRSSLMGPKKKKKVFQSGGSKSKWDSLVPTMKKKGLVGRKSMLQTTNLDDSIGQSRQSLRNSAKPVDSPDKGLNSSFISTSSTKGGNAEKSLQIIQQMHPKNERKDLCIPGDYKSEKYKIKINQKSLDMDFNDPIFAMTNAQSLKDKQEDPCQLCEKECSTFCEFCGHKACEDCLYKKRKFLVNKNSVTNEISIQTGEICKICDRKFIMKTVFKKLSEVHDKVDDKINNDCAKLSDIQQKGVALDIQKKEWALKLASVATLQPETQIQPISEEDEIVQNENLKLREQVQLRKENVISLIANQKELDEGIEEARMDYDMDKMTINQLKERAIDVEAVATKRGVKVAESYKSNYEHMKNSNSPLTPNTPTNPKSLNKDNLDPQSPNQIQTEVQPFQPDVKEFNQDELMKRVESMTYFERLNYVRSTLQLGQPNQNVTHQSEVQHPPKNSNLFVLGGRSRSNSRANSVTSNDSGVQNTVLNQFDQQQIGKLSDSQKDFLVQLLAIQQTEQASHRDTVDTHNGETYNIKGMGEGMEFGDKSDINQSKDESELTESQDFGQLDVNGLTSSRIQKKMKKKKQDKKRKKMGRDGQPMQETAECCQGPDGQNCNIF